MVKETTPIEVDEEVETPVEETNENEEEGDTFILTKWNNEKTVLGAIHTVSITRDEGTGNYYVHNAASQLTGTKYNSFAEAVANLDSNDAMIDILAIKKKE